MISKMRIDQNDKQSNYESRYEYAMKDVKKFF